MKRVLRFLGGLALVVSAAIGPLSSAAWGAPEDVRADGVAAQAVDISPDSSGLPGGPQLQKVVNGLAYLSLIALVGGVVAGAVWWGVGSAGSNPVQAASGKRMVAISLLGAVIVGGAAGLINFFNTLGSGI